MRKALTSSMEGGIIMAFFLLIEKIYEATTKIPHNDYLWMVILGMLMVRTIAITSNDK